MGTFSATHWGLAIALLAGLAAFVYLAGSLLWAGAKATGSKWKLVMLFVLLPIAIAGAAGIIGASKTPTQQAQDVEWWKKGSTPLN